MASFSDEQLQAMNAPDAPCDHGVTFDEALWRDPFMRATLNLTSEVRKRWPRLHGPCPKGCGFTGIAYASYAHYIAGDW